MNENIETALDFPGDSRIHIGLAVRDLDKARRFYQTLLGQGPTKERPGYAKFETVDPALNLSLNQIAGSAEMMDKRPTHYGIQVRSSARVNEATSRFQQAGLDVRVEEQTTCCYSIQNKVWTHDPDGNQWEVFVVTDDDAQHAMDTDSECCQRTDNTASACCATV